MVNRITPRVLRGTRDFLPERMIVRQHVIGIMREQFEKFGFQPLETPSIELAQTLEGKYGEEGEQLIYKFHDRGGRRVGLRYDLTVPMARVMAMYPNLPKPFKRYQMQPVWRADRPRRGRYREFWQCDADTVGSSSMLADAEILNLIYVVLDRLGFTDFLIRINNRKILNGLAEYAGVAGEDALGVFRAIDKLDKIGLDGVRQELLYKREQEPHVQNLQPSAPSEEEEEEEEEEVVDTIDPSSENLVPFLPGEVVESVLELVGIQGSGPDVLDELLVRLKDIPTAAQGIEELKEVAGYLKVLGVAEEYYSVDLSLARGLDYYTGPIFETELEEELEEGKGAVGSVTGGGRYDELVGMFSNESLPSTGTSLGLERIIEVMEARQSSASTSRNTLTDVFVTVFDTNTLGEALGQVRELRDSGINCEMHFGAGNLTGQLRIADRKGIPFAVITGPDEVSQDTVTLRNMITGDQPVISRRDLVDVIRSALASK